MTLLSKGNCACGNQCYKIRKATWPEGVTPSRVRYTVDWFHDPSKCPYDCEDCENEGSVRAEVELI